MASKTFRGSHEDWEMVQQIWRATGNFVAAERAVDVRLSRGLIQRRAVEEGWTRDGVAGTTITAAETLPETAERLQRAQLSIEERRKSLEIKRIQLAEDLIDTAEHLRKRILSPTTVREAKIVPQGTGLGSDVEIVDIDLPEAPAGQSKDLAIALAIAIDKSQLLTGEATSRAESGPIPTREQAVARIGQIQDELTRRRRQSTETAEAG